MREMKNSGVAWIGDVPENWEIVKIGQLFQCRNIKVNDTDFQPLSVSKGGIVPQMENVAKSDANDNRKQVLTGDFVINSRSDRKQSCGVSKLDGSVSLINTVLYGFDKDRVIPEYNNYLLKNYGFAEEFYRWGHGIVADLWTTRWQEMKNIEIPVPSIKTQEDILSALRIKSKNISLLIFNQEQQIEKLKQYKQSLITEVVTKGLNPDVSMKDSGIEWIGIISAIHNIYRLKYLLNSQMLYGANEAGSFYTNNAVRYIRITDITEDNKLKDSAENLYLSIEKAKPYILKDKDVLFARSGATVGKAFMYLNEYGKSAFAGYLIKAECNTQKLLPEYLFYYTQSSLYEYWKNMIFIQATIQNIGANKYSNMPIIQMSLDEQNQIVKFLDDKCAKIDRLIAIKQEKINKLNDYKKSLIYEYVTGKKEA